MVSSDMFDWSDEELKNILWGEAGESNDHIIPFPESKKWGQDSGETKFPATESDLHITSFDGSSIFNPCEGSSTAFPIAPWPDLPLTNDSKTDIDSMVTSKVDKASGLSQNSNAGKDEDRFPDYQWDGSFDDLDQILSNDDLIFGNASIGNTDDFWSSKVIASSPPKLDLGGLNNASANFEVKQEYLNEDEHDLTLGNASSQRDYTCPDLDQNTFAKDQGKKTSIRLENEARYDQENGHKQNRLLKSCKKFDDRNDLIFHQEINANWSSSQSSEYNNQYVPPAYGNVSISNPYIGVPVIPHMQFSDIQPMIFGYQVPNRKSMNYQTLTPQEKIEKLRRRQQMQAMVAIQKQQQQFGHNQVQDQEDGNASSMVMNDCSAEDEILYSLQKVVAKLDVSVRLCIRDSLYRLAQSATQRHVSNDSNSSNNFRKDDRAISKDEKSCRNPKIPEMETESNPIDRTVAHLLFHRPMEFISKRPDTPESSASAKFQSDHKISKSRRQFFPVEGSLCSSLLSEAQPLDQGETGFNVEISEDSSNGC